MDGVNSVSKQVNIVLNVHRNHKVYYGWGEQRE